MIACTDAIANERQLLKLEGKCGIYIFLYSNVYTRSGQTFRTKERIAKNFEAERRTDSCRKIKRVVTTADVLISTLNHAKS